MDKTISKERCSELEAWVNSVSEMIEGCKRMISCFKDFEIDLQKSMLNRI